MLPLTDDDRKSLVNLWTRHTIPARKVLRRWRLMGLADQWGPNTIAFELAHALADR